MILLSIIAVLMSSVCAVLCVVLLTRKTASGNQDAERAIREELRLGREEASRSQKDLRDEVARALKDTSEMLGRTMTDLGGMQAKQLDVVDVRMKDLGESLRLQLERLRNAVDERLTEIRQTSEKKLEEMRMTVDEKLQGTLEKRLGESFKLVSERLEAVQRGLGEMQSLVTGVGDLKRMMTNVKTRGVWGEYQLGAILEQVLTPDQYAANVQLNESSRDIVEYAIRLPGPQSDPGSCVWLPIDAKFPQEDYLRLVDAAERADADALAKASAALGSAIRLEAKTIRDKYLNPPHTTDFGILYLPTESLYAEVIRQPGLLEEIQRTCRVVISGPTTLAALLTSLRMGFRTLAIEQRASEVWKILSAVKAEFTKFGDVLDKVKKQLNTASATLDTTGQRTRAIERHLKKVEHLPAGEAALLPEAILGVNGEEDSSAEEPTSTDSKDSVTGQV